MEKAERGEVGVERRGGCRAEMWEWKGKEAVNPYGAGPPALGSLPVVISLSFLAVSSLVSLSRSFFRCS